MSNRNNSSNTPTTESDLAFQFTPTSSHAQLDSSSTNLNQTSTNFNPPPTTSSPETLPSLSELHERINAMLDDRRYQRPHRRLEELRARLAETQRLRRLAIEKKESLEAAQSLGGRGQGEGSAASRNAVGGDRGSGSGTAGGESGHGRMEEVDCDAHLEWLSTQAKEIWEEIQELEAALITRQLDHDGNEDGSEY